MRSGLSDAMTLGVAAEILGVTTAHVQHLGRTRQVTYLARGLLDGSSVRAYQAAHQGSRTRAWAGRTAWAAIDLLSGGTPGWLGQGQLSRLRSRLRAVDASGLVAATRNRASTRHYAGHASAVEGIRNDSRVVGVRSVRGMSERADPSVLECYVDDAHAEELADAFRLQPDVRGNVVLHVLPADADGAGPVSMDLVRVLMEGEVLPALEAARSEDPRESGLAHAVLQENLRRFADG